MPELTRREHTASNQTGESADERDAIEGSRLKELLDAPQWETTFMSFRRSAIRAKPVVVL